MSIKSSTKSIRLKKRVASLLTAACCSVSILGGLPSNSLNKAFEQNVCISYAANVNSSKCLSDSGFIFTRNQRYTTSGNVSIIFQSDGNLVIYSGSKYIWSSNTANIGATSCRFQSDGNLVMYNGAGKAVWETRSANKGGNMLYLDYHSGELYIYSKSNRKVIWTSKYSRGQRIPVTSGSSSSNGSSTSSTSSTSKPASNSNKANRILSAGQTFQIGKKYYSPDKKYYVVFQKDSNLVVYTSKNKAVWASGTNKKCGIKCIIQNDGNFVIYDGGKRPLWDTRTCGRGVADIYISNSGELYLKTKSGAKTWSSNWNKGYRHNYFTVLHSYTWTNTKKASCGVQGEKTGKCKSCGATTTKKTEALKHDFWLTNENEIRCVYCTSRPIVSYNEYKHLLKESDYEVPGINNETNTRKAYINYFCNITKNNITKNETLESYINKTGLSFSSLSKEEKTMLVKPYLLSKNAYGLNSDSVNLIMEAGNKVPIFNVDDVGGFVYVLDRIKDVAPITGFSYADDLSTFLGYASLGSHAYVFLNTANGSFNNAEDTIQSIVNLSSACFSVINPFVGKAYEKFANELSKMLKEVIKDCKGKSASVAVQNAIESVDGYEDYSSLADPDVYYKAIVAINQHYRNSGYGLASDIAGYNAEDYIKYFIYQEMNKDLERITKCTMEQLANKID